MDFRMPTEAEIETASKMLAKPDTVRKTVDLAVSIRDQRMANDPVVCTATGIFVGLQIAANRLNEHKGSMSQDALSSGEI